MTKDTQMDLLEMNRVDRIRQTVKNLDSLKHQLYYLMMTDSLTLSNSFARDDEKLEWLEETNAVFKELVMEMFNDE